LGIEQGTPFEIIQEEDGPLSVRPLQRVKAPDREALPKDLVEGITPENLHGEIDWGKPVGKEIW
jgi:antitoxin MazE